MTRWLPFPRISALLLVTWLLFNQSLAPAQILLGVLLAVSLPWLLARLQPVPGRPRHPLTILRLAMRVLLDIIRSNIAVASIILRPGQRGRVAGFVRIPLTMRNPNALTVLACIITATPGTVWVDYEPATGMLMIHVLDLIDENEWIHTITQRYETLLLEIFE